VSPAGQGAQADQAARHGLVEDALAIVNAALFASLGFFLLKRAGLVSGGAAGVALVLARFTHLSFGTLLLLVNLPFVALGVRELGWRFTAKTGAAVLLTSALVDGLPGLLELTRVEPLYAALAGGCLVGIALLILFRHQASLGGIGILAHWLQTRRLMRAGVFQMGADALILLAALALGLPLTTLACSVAGAVALNLVLAVNHKPGRYLGA
jgi:uncharacterized membrane-anchored protein YitT (DUF2179 family)